MERQACQTLSLEEAAVVLGVSTTSIYRYVVKGQVPGAFKMLGRWRVSRPALDAFLADPQKVSA